MSSVFTEKYFKPCVKDFVSTVLLIDDQLEYDEPPAVEGTSLITPKQGVGKNYDENHTLDSSSDKDVDDSKRKVYVTDLIKSFSKKELLVTPINPTKLDIQNKEECIDILLKLASKSDVVILDWDMQVSLKEGDNFVGDQLSIRIIKKLDEDNRYRLVLIYTADTEEDVRKKLPEALNLDVKIYGKSSITGSIVKNYEQLAEQILIDYLALKKGLLSLVLLRTLSYLRYSTYSMLDTLKYDFDKSVLSHYLLLCNISDFQDFCEGIIHDEILGYLQQSAISGFLTEELLKSIIDEKHIAYALENQNAENTSDLMNYIDSINKKDEDTIKSLRNNMIKKLTKKLSDLDTNKMIDFSLFVSTLDTNISPTLHLGCVVKYKDNYYLCIQPNCDSVRIPTKEEVEKELPKDSGKEKSKPQSFVFIQLKESHKEIDFYVKDATVYKGFLILYKQVETFYFVGDENGFVSQNDDGDFITYSSKGDFVALRYICCLKPMFAQKIANNFAANISRVGIDQFEWLRLKGRE